MKWTETFRINSHDEDPDGVIRASAVMRYLQEAANLQLQTLGPSGADLRRQGQAFLLSRVAAELYAPLHGYETVTSETWSAGSRGFSFFRCHALYRDGVLVARAKTTWALIDIATRKLLRASAYHPNFDDNPPFEEPFEEHFTVPHTEELTDLGTHTVVYPECDVNRHINNTNYPDLFADKLAMDGKRVTSFAVNYYNEAPLHETLRIYGTAHSDVHLLRSLRSDGKINAEARLVLAPIS